MAEQHDTHHPLLDRVNNALAETRIAMDIPTLRAVVTREMPIVELNALKASGVKMKPLPNNPLMGLLFGNEALEDYDRLRTARSAFTPTQLVRSFPDSVGTAKTLLPTSPGYVFSPANRPGINYARAVAAGGVGEDILPGVKMFGKGFIDPATPVTDALLNVSKMAKDPAPWTHPYGTGDLPKTGFMSSPTDVKSNVRKPSVKVVNKTPRFGFKRVVAAIPVIGAAVDITMGLTDVYRAASTFAKGEEGAGEHLQNAGAHLGDALVGAAVVGEAANIYANFKGHDGIISMAEAGLTD